MNRKNILVIIMASALSISAFTSCEAKKRVVQNSSPNSAETITEEVVEETIPPATIPPLEDAVAAQSGDAYLAFSDSKYHVQYCGKNEGDGSMLSYDAGIAHIDGDGDYSVSLTTDTKGFKYAMTGDYTKDYSPIGCGFLAVNIVDGYKLYPEMFIEIKEVIIDGKSIPINAKNYTTSVDGIESRTNIINEWIEDGYLPSDAIDIDGLISYNDGFSANIIDSNAFDKGWTNIEVKFSVIRAEKE